MDHLLVSTLDRPVLVHPPAGLQARAARAASSQAPCAACHLRDQCVAVLAGDGAPLSTRLLIGRRRLRKGELLFREGQDCAYVYAVRVGTLKTAFTLEDGHEQVTAFAFAGELVGFEGIATGRHATFAVALEDSEVCAIPYAELMRLPPTANGPAPAARFAQAAAMELVREQAAKAVASLRQADPRVAAFLLALAARMRERGFSGTEFELRMSRAEIGSYLGLTMESVSRALSTFAARGWITVSKRSIHILSTDALERLSRPAGSALGREHLPAAQPLAQAA